MGRYSSQAMAVDYKAQTRQLIELLKRDVIDVIRHRLDERYTGYDLLFCRKRGSINWRLIAVPNGEHINEHMERWIAFRDGWDSVLISSSITDIERWIGVES